MRLDVEASGQTLDWKTFIPDKVPDALNAAKHPVFESVYIDAPSFKPYGYFIDFGPLFQRLLEGVTDNFLDSNTNPNSFDLKFGEQLLNQTSHLTPLISELNEAFHRPHCQ